MTICNTYCIQIYWENFYIFKTKIERKTLKCAHCSEPLHVKSSVPSCVQLMYLVYWAFVQSEQEGRRLLPLQLPDFAIRYLFQWCTCPFFLPLSPRSLNLETQLARQTMEWWLASIIGRQRHIHSRKYLDQPFCLPTSSFGVGIYHSFRPVNCRFDGPR